VVSIFVCDVRKAEAKVDPTGLTSFDVSLGNQNVAI